MDAATIAVLIGAIAGGVVTIIGALAPVIVMVIRTLRSSHEIVVASAVASATANTVADAKADQNHKIMNSGRTLLLRKIAAVYGRLAQLSGDAADAAEYETAKADLEAAESAEISGVREAHIVRAEENANEAATKVAVLVAKSETK